MEKPSLGEEKKKRNFPEVPIASVPRQYEQVDLCSSCPCKRWGLLEAEGRAADVLQQPSVTENCL